MDLRLIFVVFLCLSLWACHSSNSTPVADLSSDQDSLSYAVGMYLGSSYRKQQIELDPYVLYQGLADAMLKDSVALDDSTALGLIQRMEAKAQAQLEAKLQALAPKQAQEAQAFLDSNRLEDDIQELNSGLQYRILIPGLGASPLLNSRVSVSYVGYLADGKEFDRSTSDSVVVRVDEMIPGLTEALTHMKPSSFWQIFIPPHLGYGERGRLPSVPPNTLLIFDLQLNEVVR